MRKNLDPFHTIPQIDERPGTYTLRADYSTYREGVYTSNWDKRREAHPKDYDVTKPENKNVHRSTYKSYGLTNDWVPGKPVSEMKARGEDFYLTSKEEKLQEYAEKADFQKRMWDRDVKKISVTTHKPYQDSRYLRTTNMDSYQPPYPYTPKPLETESMAPETIYRRVHSELYDTADHRRRGINTWQDEYHVIKPTKTEPSRIITGSMMRMNRPFPTYYSPPAPTYELYNHSIGATCLPKIYNIH